LTALRQEGIENLPKDRNKCMSLTVIEKTWFGEPVVQIRVQDNVFTMN
jgi:hypothetical protein